MRTLPRFPIAAAAVALSLVACRPDRTDDLNLEEAASNLANLMPIPATAPTLDRSGLIDAAAEAASAFAAGNDDGGLQRSMAGRRFVFRMPFGCPGYPLLDAAEEPMRLKVRDDGKSYEVRVTFSLNATDAGLAKPSVADIPTVRHDAPPAIEAVEGFWIQRPWLRVEQCPKIPIQESEPEVELEKDVSSAKVISDQPPVTRIAPDHTIGLARFFTSADSRVGARAGRDYVKVVMIAKGTTPPPGVFLVVEGRLRAWPDGKVIECRDAMNDGRPTGSRPSCIIGTSIDRVAFERADDRTVIAEWTN